MGLIPHILVLLNLDLGEHTSYAEVVKIRDRVAQELGSWQPDPRVYAFSALKLLLDRRQARGESLDPREAAVLKVWALDPDSAAFSEAEAARFEARPENHPRGLADPPPGRRQPGPGEDGGPGPQGAAGTDAGSPDPGDGRHQGAGNAPGGPASAVARHHGHREPDPGRRRPPSEEDPALPGGHASWTAIPAGWARTSASSSATLRPTGTSWRRRQ